MTTGDVKLSYTKSRAPSQRPNTESTISNENSEHYALSWMTYSESGSPTQEEIRVPTMEEMIQALAASNGEPS
jgi:hypothetical protein